MPYKALARKHMPPDRRRSGGSGHIATALRKSPVHAQLLMRASVLLADTLATSRGTHDAHGTPTECASEASPTSTHDDACAYTKE